MHCLSEHFQHFFKQKGLEFRVLGTALSKLVTGAKNLNEISTSYCNFTFLAHLTRTIITIVLPTRF